MKTEQIDALKKLALDASTFSQLKTREYIIRADHPETVFNCACRVGVECDGETVALRFPQLERNSDNLPPMVYACMQGIKLHVRLCDRDDVAVDFAWNEITSRWELQDNIA